AQAANTRANDDCSHASLLLLGVKVFSNLRTRLQRGENGVVRAVLALIRCANAVNVPFFESKISASRIRNRLFHAGATVAWFV
ncbi:hypothetical protein, partial [Klebsiella pneumoniae]|uniref:hypothetical protein n=1 Tax=Klebsiella pneumoniae TaxID=573 RepID=UPI003D0561CC